jgi:hypothetical protein
MERLLRIGMHERITCGGHANLGDLYFFRVHLNGIPAKGK